MMSKQLPLGGAGNIEQVAAAVTQASTAVVASTMVLQTLMAGTLAQVWGMINGLQLVVHLPLINVFFPQNAFIIVDKILMVATFDIPYLDLN